MRIEPLALAVIVLAAPLGAALLIALVAPLRRTGFGAAALSLLAALLATAAVALMFGQGTEAFAWPWLQAAGRTLGEVGFRLDGTTKGMLAVVTLVATMVQLYSLSYLADEERPSLGRYYGLQSLFLFSMNLAVVAPNLLQLFIGWELVGVTSYLLIGYFYKKPSAGAAALKAFAVTKLADLGFLLGLILLFLDTGGFAWDGRPEHVGLITTLLFIAVMGKSAQFPLHIWLPDAMEGPTPVSALLHAATMVAAGVYLVVRAYPLFMLAPGTLELMLYVGAFTALFAASMAVVQTDIKRVLAYSTCSQLGYMFAGLGAGAASAGFLHLITHAFFKALLFLAAGSVIHAVHSNSIDKMGGLWRRMPITAAAFIIGSAALIGIPGFSGFFSKDAILDHVGAHSPLALSLLMVTVGLTAFYVGRVVFAAFFGKPAAPEPGHEPLHAHEPGIAMLAPLMLLAVPALGLGYFASGIVESFAQPAVYAITGLPVYSDYDLHIGPITYAAVSFSALGLGGAWLVQTRGRPAFWPALERLVAYAAFNRIYRAGYGVLRSGASLIAWTDRYLVDGAINGSAWAAAELGGLLRLTQTGVVRDYIWVVFAGVVALAGYGLLQ